MRHHQADLNVIDFEQLSVVPPVAEYDLPAGGKRLLQRARGYKHTFVSGVETFRDGQSTGNKPGRLIRGAQRAQEHTLKSATTFASL